MIKNISNLKFKYYLLLPSGIVLLWLVLNIVGLFSKELLSSKLLENLAVIVAALYGLFLLFVALRLIIEKKYRQLVGLLLGLPLAYCVFFVSTVLILSGVLG